MSWRTRSSTSRFNRRQWRRRLRAWRPWLIGAGAVALAGFAVWVVLISSWLGVTSVDVRGEHRVTTAQVAAAAGIVPGTPLARVDLDAVQTRVEAIPAVAGAAVHRGWPHSIVITVTERHPIATLHAAGAWWLMDATGTLFARSHAADPAEPIVELDASPGTQTRREVAAVLAALPKGVAEQTVRVSAASLDSVTLHLANGSEVRWGNASDSALKARVLATLLPTHARFYDVSAPTEPATAGKLQASG